MIPHDRHIPMPDWTPECGDNAVLRLYPLLFLPRASRPPPANFSPKAFACSVRLMTGSPKVPRFNGHGGHPLLFTMLPCAGWVPGNKTKRPLAQPCGRGRGGMAIALCKAPIRKGPFFYDLLAKPYLSMLAPRLPSEYYQSVFLITSFLLGLGSGRSIY